MLLQISQVFGKFANPAFQGFIQLPILAKILLNSLITQG